MTSICLLPNITGLGGPASFQERLIDGLKKRGIAVHHQPERVDTGAILVNGGTRKLGQLWRAKRQEIRIVQRLNGMNWVHRKTRTGIRHFIKAEANNRLIAAIRAFFADEIIYQSQFSLDWWNDSFGEDRNARVVIHNGVDLQEFTPIGDHSRPMDVIRLLVVEGRLGSGYEIGLENAVHLCEVIQVLQSEKVELWIAGETSPELINKYETKSWITWLGSVPRTEIPRLDRSAHFLFSSDINAACPNSVIEALACGLPVVGYDTGALQELIGKRGGVVAPYGADYSSLQLANPNQLAESVINMRQNWNHYQRKARERAEEAFSMERVVEKYLKILLPENVIY